MIPNFHDTVFKYTGKLESLPSFKLNHSLENVPLPKDASQLIEFHPIEVAVDLKVKCCGCFFFNRKVAV